MPNTKSAAVSSMLDVFFTVDTEIWCDGWQDIDAKFPAAFERYVTGRTSTGCYGLHYQAERLAEYGLCGVFFVEPLFATRFGLNPLQAIVGALREHKQEVQLHLHTEWVDEATPALVPLTGAKRQYLREFSEPDQQTLIGAGANLLEQAGAARPNAFRAGGFGFNRDTLRALHANGIKFDSSYNASMSGPVSGVLPGTVLTEPVACEGVIEYPMTVFRDGTRSLRHVQLTACSWREIEGLLWQALESERKAFVILSHNFELLNAKKNRADDVVVQRFLQLCKFLDKHRDSFRVRGFHGLEPQLAAQQMTAPQPAPLSSAPWKTALRFAEQAGRRRFA